MNLHYHNSKTNCFLYSVNTYLAHYINEKFYKGIHYVWCAPEFYNDNNPPSSNPKEIYNSLYEEIKKCDKHSAKIEQNRLGLLKGVEAMFKSGVITKLDRDDIYIIIENAEIKHFTPLLYIIDQNRVKRKMNAVPRKERANVISDEFIIKDLYTNEFDVIQIW